MILAALALGVRISIHAPHEGERLIAVSLRPASAGFQSTLPTRGSDILVLRCIKFIQRFQSTLPTRGSDNYLVLTIYPINISIHAPHEGERR